MTRAGPQGDRPGTADPTSPTSPSESFELSESPERHEPERHESPERHEPSGRTDADLLAAHVAGDPDAFAALVARHRDRLWAIALRTMRNPDEAADALQDAYVAAFRRAGSYRGEAAVTTWLHRVVVNACLDRIRRNKVRSTDPLPTDPDRSAELGTVEVDDPLETQERRTDVNAALARLNADQRAALVLVDMEGYSVEEAARILGCAVGTVKSRCARGRARLVPLLAHLRGGSDDGVDRSTDPTEARR